MSNYESELANKIYNTVETINFGKNRTVKPVLQNDILKTLKEAKLPLDYRAITENRDGYKTVFEGLEFDKENVRTQSFSIYEGEKPIAVMSIAIAPKSWIKKQKYIKNNGDELIVFDYKNITNNEHEPDFFVIPAMTKVIDSHRTKLAISGFNAIKKIFEVLAEKAPQNTYMEVIAQGKLEYEKWKELENFLSDKKAGTIINKRDFPFDPNLVGKNSTGSSSTVKMARLLGLTEVENIGSVKTLGPVFIKKLK